MLVSNREKLSGITQGIRSLEKRIEKKENVLVELECREEAVTESKLDLLKDDIKTLEKALDTMRIMWAEITVEIDFEEKEERAKKRDETINMIAENMLVEDITK